MTETLPVIIVAKRNDPPATPPCFVCGVAPSKWIVVKFGTKRMELVYTCDACRKVSRKVLRAWKKRLPECFEWLELIDL